MVIVGPVTAISLSTPNPVYMTRIMYSVKCPEIGEHP